RSELFRRLRLGREGSGEPGQGAGWVPDRCGQAAGNDQRDGDEAGGDSAGRQNSRQQLRGGVLQQDFRQMSLTRVSTERTALALMLFAAATAFLLAAGALDVVFAQSAPFGAPRNAPAPPADSIIGWMFAKQAEF